MWLFSVVLKWIDLVRHECTNRGRSELCAAKAPLSKGGAKSFSGRKLERLLEQDLHLDSVVAAPQFCHEVLCDRNIIRSLKWFSIQAAASCSHFWRDFKTRWVPGVGAAAVSERILNGTMGFEPPFWRAIVGCSPRKGLRCLVIPVEGFNSKSRSHAPWKFSASV